MYVIDPRSTLMQKSALAMKTAVLALSSPELDTYVSYSSPTDEASLAFKEKNVISLSCTINECKDFAATRVVITNPKDKDFFTCGFAIMAEKMTCPPTTNQCKYAKIAASTIPTSMNIPANTNATSTSFLFTDNLSTYCDSPNVCGFT